MIRLILALLFTTTTVGTTQASTAGSSPARGDDLSVSVVRVVGLEASREEVSVILDVAWTHAWRSDRNHDAAWIFFKIGRPNGVYTHASVAIQGHRVISEGTTSASFEVPDDQAGLFVFAAQPHQGSVSWRISVRLDLAEGQSALRAGGIEAFGIEMVQVPRGPFTLGEPSDKSLEYGAFFQSDGQGNPDGLVRITSEDAIPVGPSQGALNYREARYVGDREGPVPSEFPAGFDAFYVMKHEVTQGQYAAFLNTLPPGEVEVRDPFDIAEYAAERGTITRGDAGYFADEPGFPLNFVRWDDGLAFADWAGLRPMTELEFAKAARGSREPTAGEFPWGTSSSDLIVSDGFSGVKRSSSGTEDPVTGASYFGVMNLAGATWERVITIGSADGRAFLGSHGDGLLAEANATNPDWPHTWAGKEGHGYRGGGYYGPTALAHEFNPYSPVAYRRFGGWAGADPHRAYGFRAARSTSR